MQKSAVQMTEYYGTLYYRVSSSGHMAGPGSPIAHGLAVLCSTTSASGLMANLLKFYLLQCKNHVHPLPQKQRHA